MVFLTFEVLEIAKYLPKKVKVRVCHRENVKFNSNFHFLELLGQNQ